MSYKVVYVYIVYSDHGLKLVLPHSNAIVEKVFSQVALITVMDLKQLNLIYWLLAVDCLPIASILCQTQACVNASVYSSSSSRII